MQRARVIHAFDTRPTRFPKRGRVQNLGTASRWSRGISPLRDGLCSWRHYLALLLSGVSLAEFSERLPGVLEEMAAASLTMAIERAADAGGAVTFELWLGCWLEHFGHWRDPVRDLIIELSKKDADAGFANAILTRCEPLVLLDFLLDAAASCALDCKMEGKSSGYDSGLMMEVFLAKRRRSIDVMTLHFFATLTDSGLASGEPPETFRIDVDHGALYILGDDSQIRSTATNLTSV